MAKSKSQSFRAKKNSTLIIIAITGISLFYLGYKYLTKSIIAPQPAGIFLLEQQSVAYGPITIHGSIRKELISEGKYSYILIGSNGESFVLDISEMDDLLGKKVIVDGIFTPLDMETGLRDVLKVSKIKAE